MLECCEEFFVDFLLNFIEQELGNLMFIVFGYEDDFVLNLFYEWIVLFSLNEDVGFYIVEIIFMIIGSGIIMFLENL